MKYISLSILLFFSFYTLPAQSPQRPTDLRDEPYPAPVSYANISEEEARFIALFEDKNVGNLHFYAVGNDSFLNGAAIPSFYHDFFDKRMGDQTFVKGAEPQAVFSIRGEGMELYAIRFPGEKWDHKISLFSLQNEQLNELATLAAYSDNGRRTTQVDSWMRDVNGDTRLDIIQKKRTTSKNGRVKTKTTLYLMNGNGLFKKAKKPEIQEKDYQMQDLQP